MKTLALITTALLISVSSFAKISDPSVELIDTDAKNILKFKVKKDLVGATIKLVYSNGDVVTKEELVKKKMVIDFCDSRDGEYTVVIEKGSYIERIQVKKDLEQGVQGRKQSLIFGAKSR
ncbi:MAG: hypothetical protein RIB54_13880 [Fulvivirga sp.]|uniref:hypothetical protein n=2 Tax=Fulvivirga sp. TaxID=1931237 RepID=UPI0032EF2BD7